MLRVIKSSCNIQDSGMPCQQSIKAKTMSFDEAMRTAIKNRWQFKNLQHSDTVEAAFALPEISLISYGQDGVTYNSLVSF